jgi:hypothetical protein
MPVASSWQLRIKPFELVSPNGLRVHFPYAKLEELFVALAVGHPNPVNREEVAKTLWPLADPSQRKVNLRQGIYRLRKVLSPSLIWSDAVFSGLLQDFQLTLIPDDPSAEAEEEPLLTLEQKKEPSPITDFLQLLTWFAEWDPGQMLELMQSNGDLAQGIWPTDMQDLLALAGKRLKSNHPLAGWIHIWQGGILLANDDIYGASVRYRAAYDDGVEKQEKNLAIEGLYMFGLCAILLKQLDLARRIAQRLGHLVRSISDPILASRAQDLEGTLLIHLGRTKEGLQTLSELDPIMEIKLLDLAQNQALCALYHACAGQVEAAQRLLPIPTRLARETRHFRLSAICSLAEGYVHFHGGEPEKAVNILGALAETSKSARSSHFEIYGREGVAISYWRLGEKGEASKAIRSATQIRKGINMAYTDWDHLRLMPLRSA